MLWARFILTAVMGVVLMAWVIFCGIQFIRHSRKLTAGGDFVGHVRCEKCGTEYTVKAGLHWLLLMFIGGMLILVLAGIPLSLFDRASRQQAEDMRQQRYEELKERYFGEDTD